MTQIPNNLAVFKMRYDCLSAGDKSDIVNLSFDEYYTTQAKGIECGRYSVKYLMVYQ